MLFKNRQIYNLILKRTKTTVHRINSTNETKRPTPILLLNTTLSDSQHEQYQRTIEQEWQKKFSDIGYSSYSTIMTLPGKEDQQPLVSCYQELKNVTKELSFFPPLLISFGDIAWRISEKYVSNKPVSGYIMIDGQQEPIKHQGYPINEFEPLFPMLMLSKQQPPEFLQGYIDHLQYDKEANFDSIVQWLDDYGM